MAILDPCCDPSCDGPEAEPTLAEQWRSLLDCAVSVANRTPLDGSVDIEVDGLTTQLDVVTWDLLCQVDGSAADLVAWLRSFASAIESEVSRTGEPRLSAAEERGLEEG